MFGDGPNRSPVNATPVQAPRAKKMKAARTGNSKPGGNAASGRYTEAGSNSAPFIACSGV
ncbi:hypothetical protein FG87_31990 [Nocardia vulneris]|uniref:Uncharacterized protein n=1 Tax=Nocardia vulneris TaxID=1141657 RepID=A0ABR4Z7C7_9NOCA|nr:hypothetical protein FG87_31990 [Nocardia vulneris]